jgi:uncharacterized membrane protein
MTVPAVFWPTLLGSAFFIAGILTYRRDLLNSSSPRAPRLFALGPVFIAAAMAAFAGEHFTAAKALSTLVPKWLPARVFITYFVGVAHLAAALSLVARRCLRWSTFLLGIMFALFVLLLHLPNAIMIPGLRIAWIVAVRETTFALGAFSLFAAVVWKPQPSQAKIFAAVASFWTGLVLIYFGLENAFYPQFLPGVPDTQPTYPWVPFPHALAYLTGTLLVVFGIVVFARRYASLAAACAGSLMLLLTLALFVPQYLLAGSAADKVTAINFVADTLLFSGTLFAIAHALVATAPLGCYTSDRPLRLTTVR